MTKVNAVKRDAYFQKIQGLMAEVTSEIRAYQEAFANDGFMHSVDEYANSMVGALMTTRGILLAITGVTEPSHAEEEPQHPEIAAENFFRWRNELGQAVAPEGLAEPAPRLRPR